MIISVASGKGGTGKTTIAVSLALSLDDVQLLDCDVEEPNAHIFLKPVIRNSIKASIPVPVVDKTKCDLCGKCADVCMYNAIAVMPKSRTNAGRVLVFPQLCHGCGACTMFCPQQAIREVERPIGEIQTGKKSGVVFAHGRLDVGEAMSPPLIRQVKRLSDISTTVIIDAPPGTSCPVIAAVKDSDFCLLVTEPTPFGMNDLILAVEAMRKLKIPVGVIINRCDMGNDKVETYCKSQNIPVLMKIPFRKEIAEAYSNGNPLIEPLPQYKEQFKEVFNKIETLAGKDEKKMKAKKAVEYFRGLNGKMRLNCAQSVAAAFMDDGFTSNSDIEGFWDCGFGEAPDGYCGSIYAALSLLRRTGNDGRLKELTEEFIAYTGSLKCKEIRTFRRVSCRQTVAKAVELLERLNS